MFNNVVLDVFIGLVLVFLLYSLLVTIVGEMIVSWICLRSRILRVSIEKMLNDGYLAKRSLLFIIQRFFLREFPAFKESFAAKFYKYPSIKYLVAGGGEKRTFFTRTKPSYISDENFADALMQLLKSRGAGDTDFDKIRFALQFNTQHIQPASLQRIRDLLENADTDLEAFKKNLKGWFNETQDRTTGWYKRKLQLILFWLGFLIAIIFNVDTIRIAKILAKDKDARNQLVAMGIELSKDSARYQDFLKENDSVVSKAILDSSYRRITQDINEANLVLGLGWGTDKLFKPLKRSVDSSDRNAFAAIRKEFSIIDSIQRSGKSILVTGKRHYKWYEKFTFVLGAIFSGYRIIGLIITGLMLSLGAPFWFDLLKKLVSIRGDGIKPEEKKDKSKNDIVFGDSVPSAGKPALVAGPPTGAQANRAQAEAALNSLTQKIKNEKGIIAVAIEYTQDQQPYLMVMAEDMRVQQFLENKYGNTETLPTGFNIPIRYSIDNEIQIQRAVSGSAISNETLSLGSGTLGCQMKRKDSNDLFFISCWHVMKDNIRWDVAPVNTNIVYDTDRQLLGKIEEGFLSHNTDIGIDLGIARFVDTTLASSNENFSITAQHRAITAFDSLVSTPVKLFGRVSKLQEARIFHDKINARIKYPDGTIHLLNDVFSLVSRSAGGGQVTSQGDSGAVVIDENGVPLGMIIGGNGNFSYAMKFSNVFDTDKPFGEYFFKI